MRPYNVWKVVNGVSGNWWTEYQADVKKHGDYCGSCHKRFRSRHGAIICQGCAEDSIVRLDRRPDLGYKEFVYALFDETGVIYIGVTRNPVQRLQQHLADKDFDYMGLIKGFSKREKAEEFEAFCIEFYRPTLNRLVKPSQRVIPHQWKQDLYRIAEESERVAGITEEDSSLIEWDKEVINGDW